MRIQQITPVCYRNINKTAQIPFSPNFGEVDYAGGFCDGFFRKTVPENENWYINHALKKSKKLGIKEFKQLSLIEKHQIRKKTNPEIREAADNSVRVGLALKQELDKTYGKDKYTFISIGTSPSGIGRIMEFSGVETKYLPISNLREIKTTKEILDKNPNIDKYKNFLEEQGITQEQIDKSDKTMLFFDFTSTGHSLYMFQKMMGELFGIDTDSKKVCFIPINKELNSIQTSKTSPHVTKREISEYVGKYMGACEIDKMGGIPHLSYDELEEINDCKNDENKESKLFNFFVIDRLRNLGFMENNPRNDNSL